MKRLVIIIAIVIFSIAKLNAQNPTKSNADFAWESLQEIRKSYASDSSRNLYNSFRNHEYFSRKLLEKGIALWEQLPKDKRRIQWFESVNSYSAPEFWENIEDGARAKAQSPNNYSALINWKGLNAWEMERLRLRKVIMDDKSVSESTKQRICEEELGTEMSRNSNIDYRRSKEEFITRIKIAFENGFSHLKPGDDYGKIYRKIDRIFFNRNIYDLTTQDLTAFIKYFKNSNHREIQQWAMQKLSLFALQKDQFELKHYTVEGKEIDLTKLRGKVVLVDFWDLGCSVCIKRMPAIKQVYDKYKDKGFIVISAARNGNIDKERILAIHERIGADWPLLIIGGDSDKSGHIAPNSISDKIWKKYGFNYVPQLLLLDKEGKLAEYNGILFNGNFEPLVKKLLAEKFKI